MSTILGRWHDHGHVHINIARLIETRALIQANSGSGKSYALRKLLEVTAGSVQQLIIDPEGEFASLREKHDLIIAAAAGGDTLASPRTAKLLAIRLLETHASAVIDLSEVKAHDRHSFVRLFFESLIDAPKKLRHPVLVVLDEGHLYCPEKGQGDSEATEAVIDMAARGRKRGLCLVVATQRIGKFHKSAAAELKNKLIGGTGLDIDVKRAAFELGMQPKEAMQALRQLQTGGFYAFGPASDQVDPRIMKVGPVETSHPKVGTKISAPPKPSDAIAALLPMLADLPKEAEEEARTIKELQIEVHRLHRELQSQLKAEIRGIPDPTMLAKAEQAGHTAGFKDGVSAVEALLAPLINAVEQSVTNLGAAQGDLWRSIKKLKPTQIIPRNIPAKPAPKTDVHRASNPIVPPAEMTEHLQKASMGQGGSQTVRKILDVIHRSYPVSLSFDAAARRAAVSSKSSAYRKYRAAVETSEELEHIDGKFRSRPEYAGRSPINGDASIDEWVSKLPPTYGKMLRAIYESGPVDKETVADLAGVSRTSSGLGSGLRELISLQLIVDQGGQYAVADGLR